MSQAQKETDRGPLLGALLRLAHQMVIRRVLATLVRAGYDDVQASFFAPLQALWDLPRGARATDLAARAKMTKQSMGELLDQLARRGYVERISDPDDARARLVRITPRGRKAGRIARAAVRDVEAEWAQKIGARRVGDLRRTLRLLVARD